MPKENPIPQQQEPEKQPDRPRSPHDDSDGDYSDHTNDVRHSRMSVNERKGPCDTRPEWPAGPITAIVNMKGRNATDHRSGYEHRFLVWEDAEMKNYRVCEVYKEEAIPYWRSRQ